MVKWGILDYFSSSVLQELNDGLEELRRVFKVKKKSKKFKNQCNAGENLLLFLDHF